MAVTICTDPDAIASTSSALKAARAAAAALASAKPSPSPKYSGVKMTVPSAAEALLRAEAGVSLSGDAIVIDRKWADAEIAKLDSDTVPEEYAGVPSDLVRYGILTGKISPTKTPSHNAGVVCALANFKTLDNLVRYQFIALAAPAAHTK